MQKPEFYPMFTGIIEELGRVRARSTVGACERGVHYQEQFPGWGGKLLFLAVTGSVVSGSVAAYAVVR